MPDTIGAAGLATDTIPWYELRVMARTSDLVVHVRRRVRGRTAWCGARTSAWMLDGLDHAAELSSSGDSVRTCARCASVAAAAVLAGADEPEPTATIVQLGALPVA